MSTSTTTTKPVLAPLKQAAVPVQSTNSGNASPSSGSAGPSSPTAVKKRSASDVLTRTVFTMLMAYLFLMGMPLGFGFSLCVALLVLLCIFYEVTRINKQERKERQLPSLRVLKWFLMVHVTLVVIIATSKDPVVEAVPALAHVFPVLPFILFSGIILGLVFFVLSLRKGMYRYQFIHLTWTVMTLIITQSQFAAELRNMSRGIIWFLLPVTMVINNDTWAYIWGKLFGRTRLLALSPKKTLEGFLGAFITTLAWSFWFSGFLAHFPSMYCPVESFWPSHNVVNCERAPLFIQAEVPLPSWVQRLSGGRMQTMLIAPVQKHAIVLGVFASLVAPFGGFFASGLKRAFKLKDFGNLIPGHGGMTDRMDCQGIMGLCVYFYLRTYIYYNTRCPGTDDVVQCALGLPRGQRQSLMKQLAASLA